jgi:hypothetical protein
MRPATIAAAVGKGLVAGAAGTAVMTVSSMLEARLRGRDASSAPAEALEHLLDVEPADEAAAQRLNHVAHWGYGTALGALRGLIGVAGLRGAPAAATHFGLVWGAEQAVLPALDVSPPAWEWSPEEVGLDALHHLVYAAATGIAYELLDR